MSMVDRQILVLERASWIPRVLKDLIVAWLQLIEVLLLAQVISHGHPILFVDFISGL